MKDYLIIDRSKWRTGSEGDNSTGKGWTVLLNKHGYMCCLGFRCHQMGIPKEDLLDEGSPKSLSDKWDIPDLLNTVGNDSHFALKAMRINDNKYLTSEEREEKIKQHFATIGVTVEFKGKYK